MNAESGALGATRFIRESVPLFFVESALYFMKVNMMTKALIFNDAHVVSSLTWPLHVGRQVSPELHSGTCLLRTKVTAFAINVLKLS